MRLKVILGLGQRAIIRFSQLANVQNDFDG